MNAQAPAPRTAGFVSASLPSHSWTEVAAKRTDDGASHHLLPMHPISTFPRFSNWATPPRNADARDIPAAGPLSPVTPNDFQGSLAPRPRRDAPLMSAPSGMRAIAGRRDEDEAAAAAVADEPARLTARRVKDLLHDARTLLASMEPPLVPLAHKDGVVAARAQARPKFKELARAASLAATWGEIDAMLERINRLEARNRMEPLGALGARALRLSTSAAGPSSTWLRVIAAMESFASGSPALAGALEADIAQRIAKIERTETSALDRLRRENNSSLRHIIRPSKVYDPTSIENLEREFMRKWWGPMVGAVLRGGESVEMVAQRWFIRTPAHVEALALRAAMAEPDDAARLRPPAPRSAQSRSPAGPVGPEAPVR